MRILLGIGEVIGGTVVLVIVSALLARAFWGPIDIDRHDDDEGSP